jgi:FkbM family methyltransferase
MTAFDLGANVGYYTVMMAKRVGTCGCVYAVEPSPQSFGLLVRNVRLNRLDNVRVEEVAIAEHDGTKDLLLAEKSNWHSVHSPQLATTAPWCEKYLRTMVGSLPVRTRSLHGYLCDRKPIDLLRMDIEGYETEILGAVSKLPPAARARMRILFETHPEFYSPPGDMRRVLRGLCHTHGFRVTHLVSDFHFGARQYDKIEAGEEVFRRRGYDTRYIVRQFRNRAIYAGLGLEDAIDLICESECVHAALLTPEALIDTPLA